MTNKSRQLEFSAELILAELGHDKPLQYREDIGQVLIRGCAAERLESYSAREIEESQERISRLIEAGIGVTHLVAPDYPALLSQISDPPLLLYYRGELSSITDRAVAVVGSRAADRGGLDIARGMAHELAAARVMVVSGLAIGIDAAAHEGAIASGVEGATAAVLGNGLSTIYPSRHAELAGRIVAEGGLIISQFSPGTPPYPGNFLNRNRVIAGLSLGVLVVQADLRSGSLVTARHALDAGREVLAVPGAITDPRHRGTNRLIRDGATTVTSALDIFEALPVLAIGSEGESCDPSRAADSQDQTRLRPSAGIDPRVSKLAPFWDGAPHDVSELMSRSMLGELDLLELEIKGILERLPGDQLRVVLPS